MKHIRRLRHVKRWGIVPRIHEQSVAEHSYYVAKYAGMISDALGVDAMERAEAVQYALDHDLAESFMGDIPSPLKEAHPELEATEQEFRDKMGVGFPVQEHTFEIVHLADKIEATVWLIEERLAGNKAISNLVDNMVAKTKDIAARLGGGVESLVDDIFNEASEPLDWYIQ